MTDLQALTDAFAELERRADAAGAARQPELPTLTRPRPVSRPSSRLVPVAATVVVVAGLAVGAALLVPSGRPDTQAGTPPTAKSSSAQPAASATSAPAVPRNSQELADRFRAVLGDTATFTVTDIPARSGPPASLPPARSRGSVLRVPPPDSATNPETEGAMIVGTLTRSGVTGGFYLSVDRSSPGQTPICADLDRATCTKRTLADGSALAIGEEKTDTPNGVLYLIDLIRPDGVQFLFNLSNERDPKGGSETLGAHPPMTIEQMIAVLTSGRW
jgi:hypothetical protein